MIRFAIQKDVNRLNTHFKSVNKITQNGNLNNNLSSLQIFDKYTKFQEMSLNLCALDTLFSH